MDIVLLSEVIKEQDLWAYPYNALRNQALSRAATDVSHPLTYTQHIMIRSCSTRTAVWDAFNSICLAPT